MVVPRHASLPIPYDVDGAKVADLAIRCMEVTEEAGVVVVSDGSWVVDAEGVESIGKG